MARVTRFINDGTGLEKTLRLIQSLAQIAAVFTVGSTAVRLTTAKLQLALSRRFFRFFCFLESFEQVSALLTNGGRNSVAGWLDLGKWTSFGLYFITEDLTILHAMGVWTVPWEERVMRQANTYWFFALCFSLAGSLYKIFFSAPTKPANKSKSKSKNGKEKKTEEPVVEAPKTSALVQQFVVDSCDLLLPLELLGWYPTGDLVLGVTMVLSTILTGWNVWARV
ncbi:hypothetical protein N7456_001709 [Penicillium angulare]|uniref:Peroxisomal biogenesis factor 11 n=1 Tax=Penicillium angulare TaxID=116970 RepID=A0A9W9KP38_9EURO|nr:hypothetical protein N7456_001709 [Penicillium angulare]